MAQEFVDLYEVLDLPVDAERGAVRKRINERYLDAQRNLDHRDFATRVKHQELFEVTLPQARYILLDDGRRDEYNRMVNAFRAPSGFVGPAPVTPAPQAESTLEIPQSTGFSLEAAPTPAFSTAPDIAPLPPTPLDPVQLAQEREELWKKWKSGLEAAMTTENSDKPKARGAVTAAPTSFSAPPTPDSKSQAAPPAPTVIAPMPVAAPTPPPPKPAPPKVKISFDFGGEGNEDTPRRGDSAPAPGAEEIVADHKLQHSEAEIEARRAENRLQITKEILINVGLIWGIAGAAMVVVPVIIALIAANAHYFPRNAPPLAKFSPFLMWGVGFLIMAAGGFFASRELSKSMRRKKAAELSGMSYEELLRQTGKG